MRDILKQFQGTIFEMFLSGRLSEEEFDILSALTEGMETDESASELVAKLKLLDLNDKDIMDCINARQFKTALMILA